MTHPKLHSNIFKSFIFSNSIINIFIIFISIYFLTAIIFSVIYLLSVNGFSFVDIIKFSISTSFGFDSAFDLANTNINYSITIFHQIISLLISTIFTSAIVLKYFLHPTFFIFKSKTNLYKDENDEKILAISLYNGTRFFATNCNIRVYGRMQTIDNQGKTALININDNQPVFEKTYPFMEQHLVTRLRIQIDKNDMLKELFENDSKNKKLDLIVLLEANVSKLDNSIYEVFKYSIDFDNLENTITKKEYMSMDIDFNNDNKTNEKEWEKFED